MCKKLNELNLAHFVIVLWAVDNCLFNFHFCKPLAPSNKLETVKKCVLHNFTKLILLTNDFL